MSGNKGMKWDQLNRLERMKRGGTEDATGKVELRMGRQAQEAMLVNAARGGVSSKLVQWLANPEPPLPDPVDAETPPRSDWHLALLGPYEPTAAYYGEG